MSGFIFFLGLVLCLVIFLFVVWRMTRNLKYNDDTIFTTLFLSLLAFFIGGRLGHIVFHLSDFGLRPFRWIALMYFPGVWWFTGSISLLVILYILTKKYHMNYLQMLDIFMYSAWIMLIVYLPFRMLLYPEMGRLSFLSEITHPVTLYRLVLLMIVLIPLLVFLHDKPLFTYKTKHTYGIFSCIFLAVIGLQFMLIDFTKVSYVYYYRLTLDQIAGCITTAVCIVVLIILIRKKGKKIHI